jgi:hypothetical protein
MLPTDSKDEEKMPYEQAPTKNLVVFKVKSIKKAPMQHERSET